MYYVLFYLREYTARKIFARIESEEKKTDDDDTFLNFFESSCTKLAPKQHISHDYVKERKERAFFFVFFRFLQRTVTVID